MINQHVTSYDCFVPETLVLRTPVRAQPLWQIIEARLPLPLLRWGMSNPFCTISTQECSANLVSARASLIRCLGETAVAPVHQVSTLRTYVTTGHAHEAKSLITDHCSKDWYPFKNDFRSTLWTRVIAGHPSVVAGAFDVILIADDLVGLLLNCPLPVADIAR